MAESKRKYTETRKLTLEQLGLMNMPQSPNQQRQPIVGLAEKKNEATRELVARLIEHVRKI